MIYLIPSFLAENAVETIPEYVMTAIKDCQVIFAENERTARRFLKSLDKEIVIDDYEWHTIHKAEKEQINTLRERIKEKKNIAIISEAGCPGIADPGQLLIHE
ncbi:MAG: SAM-dependent methyltransferase, partial [Ginsengibacter sp.]